MVATFKPLATAPTAPTLTGRAYGLSASASLFGQEFANVAPIPDTGSVSTTGSSTTSTPCVATLTGIVTAGVLCANVTTAAPPGTSTASASLASASVGGLSGFGIPTVTVDAVQSSSTTTCSGSSGTTTIDYLAVGGDVIISSSTQVAPNTEISVGGVNPVLNEQIPVTGPDQGLIVNAVHISVNNFLVGADVVLSSSESDIGNCP